MNNFTTKKMILRITYSAFFLALAFILPTLTGMDINQAICPMHIPVLLCGFICGPVYGAVVGFSAPLLRSLMFGMPPIFPTAISMAFELLTYGLLSGVLYKLLPRKIPFIYVNLIGSMVAGRITWGIVRYIMTFLSDSSFSLELFVNGAIVTALPGIIVQIVLIPLLVVACQKGKIIQND